MQKQLLGECRIYATALWQVAKGECCSPTVDAWLTSLVVPDTLRFLQILEVRTGSVEAQLAWFPLDHTDNACKLIYRLLGVLLLQRRIKYLPQIAQFFHQQLLTAQQQVEVEVQSAIPLSIEQQQRLVAKLAQKTAQKISLKCTVVPQLLGGMVVRFLGKTFDGSVRYQLQQLRRQLLKS